MSFDENENIVKPIHSHLIHSVRSSCDWIEKSVFISWSPLHVYKISGFIVNIAMIVSGDVGNENYVYIYRDICRGRVV